MGRKAKKDEGAEAPAKEEKVKLSTKNPVDETRVSIEEITGDNVIEKLTQNDVAKNNIEAAKLGRA